MIKRTIKPETQIERQPRTRKFTYHPEREIQHRLGNSVTRYDLNLIGMPDVVLEPGRLIEISDAQMENLIKDASFRQMLGSGALNEIDVAAMLPSQVHNLPEEDVGGAIAQCENVKTLYQYALTVEKEQNRDAIAKRALELKEQCQSIYEVIYPKDRIVEIENLTIEEALKEVETVNSIEILGTYMEQEERQAVKDRIIRRMQQLAKI